MIMVGPNPIHNQDSQGLSLTSVGVSLYCVLIVMDCKRIKFHMTNQEIEVIHKAFFIT